MTRIELLQIGRLLQGTGAAQSASAVGPGRIFTGRFGIEVTEITDHIRPIRSLQPYFYLEAYAQEYIFIHAVDLKNTFMLAKGRAIRI
jgi:hypothetical protein